MPVLTSAGLPVNGVLKVIKRRKEPVDVWDHIRWLDRRWKRRKQVKSQIYVCDHIHCPGNLCLK